MTWEVMYSSELRIEYYSGFASLGLLITFYIQVQQIVFSPRM
jgi:hypothetical protein